MSEMFIHLKTTLSLLPSIVIYGFIAHAHLRCYRKNRVFRGKDPLHNMGSECSKITKIYNNDNDSSKFLSKFLD